MSGQPEITERIPKRFKWRYRCFGVPNTRVRKMGPSEVRLAWIKTGFHLVLFLLFIGLALFAASAFNHQLSFPAIAIYLVLLLYGTVNFYAFWAYLRCAVVRKVITFAIHTEDLVQPHRRNLILSRVLRDSGLPAELDVWMPSQIAAIHSKSPYARFASWAVPIPARIERFATANPSFVPDSAMTRDDRYELLGKLGQLAFLNVGKLVAYGLLIFCFSYTIEARSVQEPAFWRGMVNTFAAFLVFAVIRNGYRLFVMALDGISGQLRSNEHKSAYWLRYSKIPWFEHGLPAAWRTEETLTEFPPTLPRSITKQIPV